MLSIVFLSPFICFFEDDGNAFTITNEMITKMKLFLKISSIYCVMYFFFLYLRRGIDEVSSLYANKEQSI